MILKRSLKLLNLTCICRHSENALCAFFASHDGFSDLSYFCNSQIVCCFWDVLTGSLQQNPKLGRLFLHIRLFHIYRGSTFQQKQCLTSCFCSPHSMWIYSKGSVVYGLKQMQTCNSNIHSLPLLPTL